MIKSQFTMIVPDKDKKDGFIAFNTRTQALMGITKEVKEAIRKLPDESAFQGHENILEALYKNSLIVKDKEEDRDNLDKYYSKTVDDPTALTFEIELLTTLACNFACDYCYQENAKTNEHLSLETADKVIDWLKYQITEHGYKKIHITFYGGEPLVNKKPIYYISERMKPWCDERDVKFHFGMVTNGYLLYAHEVDDWMKLGMNQVRITIDGDRESHDNRRILHSGKGTFDQIIDNIEAIIDKPLSVGVSGNYDRDNYEAMVRLLDYLDERGLLRKLKRLGFTPLLPRLGPKDSPLQVELTDCAAMYSDDYFKMNLLIRQEMQKRGLEVPVGLSYVGCTLIQKHGGVQIGPDGEIYKCPVMIGYPQYAVGHVSDVEYNEKLDEFINLKTWEKCPSDCTYLPTCGGGCRIMAAGRHGNFEDIYCEKANINRMAKDLIQMDYERTKRVKEKELVKS